MQSLSRRSSPQSASQTAPMADAGLAPIARRPKDAQNCLIWVLQPAHSPERILGREDVEPPLAGRLSRLRWVTRRMITSMQKLQYLDSLCLAGQGSQGLLRAPQNPRKPAAGRLIPQESHGRNGTLRYAFSA